MVELIVNMYVFGFILTGLFFVTVSLPELYGENQQNTAQHIGSSLCMVSVPLLNWQTSY